VSTEKNAAEGDIFLLSLEFGIAETQEHRIRNDGDPDKSQMDKKKTPGRTAGHPFNRHHCAQQRQPSKKARGQTKKRHRQGTAIPRQAAIGLTFSIQCQPSLLLAPNAENRERSRKKREAADRQTGINLGSWGEREGECMSRGACA
jgi:hypothetical protein